MRSNRLQEYYLLLGTYFGVLNKYGVNAEETDTARKHAIDAYDMLSPKEKQEADANKFEFSQQDTEMSPATVNVGGFTAAFDCYLMKEDGVTGKMNNIELPGDILELVVTKLVPVIRERIVEYMREAQEESGWLTEAIMNDPRFTAFDGFALQMDARFGLLMSPEELKRRSDLGGS